MNIPFLKMPAGGGNSYRYIPLNAIMIELLDGKNIDRIHDISGRTYCYLTSTTNIDVKIESMSCSSYEEFIIALNTYDLVHDMSIGMCSDTNIRKEYNTLFKRFETLKSENDKLKTTLAQFKEQVSTLMA